MLYFYILIAFFSLAAWQGLKFYQNYKAAQKIGFPILASPVDKLNPFWLLTKDFLTPLLRCLPFGLGEFSQRAYMGWNFPDFYKTHARLKSDAFTIVTPGELEVYIADPESAEDILKRAQTDFVKSPALYDMLNLLGQNVNTTNGKTWQRHRRITAPPFNERNSVIVWQEALKQTREVLEFWEELGNVRTTTDDSMTLALHVLMAASLGVNYSFRESLNSKPQTTSGHTLTYRDALNTIIRNMGLAILFRMVEKLPIPNAMLPAKMKNMKLALDEFYRYLTQMVKDERVAIASTGNTGSNADKANLMSVLLRSSDQAKEKAKARANLEATMGNKSPTNIAYLSDEEVYGNLFIYNAAGHDTTANTISYAVTLLAIYPEWQKWIGEEVDKVFSDGVGKDAGQWDYEKSFPRLRKCQAIMFETLRLYSPVVSVPRYTAHSRQKLSVNGKSYDIPPRTNIFVNIAALHTNPRYWGNDALAWRPSRWITKSTSLDEDTIIEAQPPGVFIPWTSGPRVCPGKKFAQVEFVAVLAAMMSSWRVGVVREGAETQEQSRTRVLQIVQNSKVEFTLKMKKPNRVGLKWTRKSK
ncbi:hypothetical protein BP6252_10444 [Coleophoma cylindrospora]|uniref:Cytochrome P450 n=1 Tax=Coleophoma cylindrospora TaxID=1849047 RepID=A0A3D8QSJ4_9HELO|nr:hypothetical protein BP6252_10444 [Coleophoma cylindrospora]